MEIVNAIKNLVDMNFHLEIKEENLEEIALFLNMEYDELCDELLNASERQVVSEIGLGYETENALTEEDVRKYERVVAKRFGIEAEAMRTAVKVCDTHDGEYLDLKLQEFFNASGADVVLKQYEYYLAIIKVSHSNLSFRQYEMIKDETMTNMWHILLTKSYKTDLIHFLYIEVNRYIKEKNYKAIERLLESFQEEIKSQKMLAKQEDM